MSARRQRRFRNCWERPRREMCELVGRRMQKMGTMASANAWNELGRYLETKMSEQDIPKFMHLITAMRAYTIRYASVAKELERKGYEIY